MLIHFHIIYVCSNSTMAELSSWHRGQMVWKAWDTWHLDLCRESLSTLALDRWSLNVLTVRGSGMPTSWSPFKAQGNCHCIKNASSYSPNWNSASSSKTLPLIPLFLNSPSNVLLFFTGMYVSLWSIFSHLLDYLYYTELSVYHLNT